jgi:hypothetical protein
MVADHQGRRDQGGVSRRAGDTGTVEGQFDASCQRLDRRRRQQACRRSFEKAELKFFRTGIARSKNMISFRENGSAQRKGRMSALLFRSLLVACVLAALPFLSTLAGAQAIPDNPYPSPQITSAQWDSYFQQVKAAHGASMQAQPEQKLAVYTGDGVSYAFTQPGHPRTRHGSCAGL